MSKVKQNLSYTETEIANSNNRERVASQMTLSPENGAQTDCGPLMTPKEAARALRVSDKTLAQWRWLDRGPCYVKLGSAVRYPSVAISDFIAANTNGGTASDE